MSDFFSALALLPEGWSRDVRITLDAGGTITGVASGAGADGARRLPGPVLPGMPNLHSHAFQRAMAGRLEQRRNGEDSFWAWRRRMYEFVAALEPDDLEAIAAFAYCEMLEAGYTAVGEFHYIHHGPLGKRYARRTEMADRIVRAARAAGIGLTLLPVFYESGDFGGAHPEETQLRLTMRPLEFVALWDSLAQEYGGSEDVRIGAAPHSLRAVSLDALAAIQDALRARDSQLPMHIHVAEQKKEVDDCVAWCGKAPIALLLEKADLSLRWTLVHATHASPDELDAIVRAKAVVALCPTTEANLGDGIFSAAEFVRKGGSFGIGSDSHVTIDVAAELRLLEYTQRLKEERRSVLCSDQTPSVGEFLYRNALAAGAYSLGRQIGAIARGYRADLVVLDPAADALAVRERTQLLDGFVFTGGREAIHDVIVGGKVVVEDHKHVAREAIVARYRDALLRFVRKR